MKTLNLVRAIAAALKWPAMSTIAPASGTAGTTDRPIGRICEAAGLPKFHRSWDAKL